MSLGAVDSLSQALRRAAAPSVVTKRKDLLLLGELARADAETAQMAVPYFAYQHIVSCGKRCTSD